MRRVRAEKVCVGEIELGKGEAHHARDVLRMKVGEEIEVFDDGGGSAVGRILRSDRERVVVAVQRMNESAPAGFAWTVASAGPQGNRGDWMIEKLSELGTSLFIPLAAKRSVVLPEGKGKRGRWERLASEAAKQSKRRGVMGIGELMTVAEVVGELNDSRGWYLST